LEKLPKPRKDYGEIKDNFFSHLFHFTSSKAWVFLGLIFAIGTMSLLGIEGQNAQNYTWLFGVLILLFIGTPLFFRFKYFREIPKGWTREQVNSWEKLKNSGLVIKQGFSTFQKILAVYTFGLVIVSLVAGIVNFKLLFVIIPIGIIVLVLGCVAHIYKGAYENYKKNKSFEENNYAEMRAVNDAVIGKHGGSKALLQALAFIFVPFSGIAILFLISKLSEIQLTFLSIGIIALVLGIILYWHSRKEKMDPNDAVLNKLKKKFG